MKQRAGPRVSGLLGISIAVAAGLSAQTLPGDPLVTQVSSQKGVLPCPAETDFAGQGYHIGHATVDDPFQFLYWIAGASQNVNAQLATQLNGKPYSIQLVKDGLNLFEQARFAPDNQASFSIRVEQAFVQNCDAQKKTLDVVYRIYSTDPPAFLGGAPESQQTMQTSPQTTTGLNDTASPVRFTPAGGYNRSDGMFGGGSMVIQPKWSGVHLFDTLTAQGEGSYSFRYLSAALAGSGNWKGWLQHADWRMTYWNSSQPAGATRLQQGSLAAQFEGTTRPFWNNDAQARFGALVEGGNQQSSVPVNLLPVGTIANAGYGSIKMYAGLSSRTTYNVLAVSYGLQLGSVGPAARIDWRKHIGDVDDEFWIPVADHKPLEVETRATFGGIQTTRGIPLAERFFGGNSEQDFMPGDAWQIRDEPVIRAIPADRLYLTAAGAGADQFASINLTTSYPVKSRPIMPKEVSTDKEFDNILQSQINTATNVDQNYYTWKDPHFAAAYKQLPDLQKALTALQTAVTAAQNAHPGQFPDQFGDCVNNLYVAAFDVSNALGTKTVGQYGNLQALLPAGSNDLQSAQDACVGELNSQLKDTGITSAWNAVDTVRTPLLADFNQIDNKTAAAKAAGDMAFVKRTLNTLFHQVNIFSISPVAVLDWAWIGPSAGALGGSRLGPGAGIRLEIASAVNFTLGYAWNVDHRPGEGKGALFFSIGLRDLFH